jgi:hypothetical protein
VRADYLDRVDRGMARCLLCRVSWLRRKDAKAQLAGCVEILVLIANLRLAEVNAPGYNSSFVKTISAALRGLSRAR